MKYKKWFKQVAIRISDVIGVKNAAQQLKVPYSTLSNWRHLRGSSRMRGAKNPEQERLERENRMLKDVIGLLTKE